MNPKQIQLSAHEVKRGSCSKSIVKTFLIPLTLLLTITAAFARLGETPDQCQMRYGSTNGQKGAYALYYKDHFDIAVLFRDGKSVEEIFTANVGATLSDDKIAELLSANSEGSSWSIISKEPAHRIYRRSDRGAYATFDISTSDTSLSISSVFTAAIVPGKKPTAGGF